MKPSYIIERWPHGWLLCAAKESGQSGIPMMALNECLPMFPADSGVDSGIARYHRYARGAVMAVGSPEELGLWREEIEKEISWMADEPRWFLGCDTGMSSLAVFSKLTSHKDYANKALDEINGKMHHPHDADDFGRCFRLVELMQWHDRIYEMAPLSPEWKSICERWQSLCELHQQGKLGIIEFPK